MREQIKRKITRAGASVISEDELADQILSLLIEEIKKELLTDEEIEEALIKANEQKWAYGVHPTYEREYVLLQAQLQKIIKRLSE